MHTHNVPTLVLLAMLVFGAAPTPAAQNPDARAAAATPTAAAGVISPDLTLRRLIAAGRMRSATFAELVDRVHRGGAVVYVMWTVHLPRNLEAALDHRITVLPTGTRCFWVLVRRTRASERLIALVGHELQHALEAVESNARTSADMERAFRREGTGAADSVFDSRAAIEVQERIAKELGGSTQHDDGETVIHSIDRVFVIRPFRSGFPTGLLYGPLSP
jgi:hypothetical protein